MKILVVGGVAGGASAVARIRRLDENAQIILFERGQYVSFANCGLPYYIGKTIEERSALFVSNPESIRKKYNVDVRINNEVLSIDRENKKIRVLDKLKGVEYDESYDKLLLSTGSKPFIPNVKGLDERNVFSLWTINDTDKIYSFIEENNPKKAVVVGGGFIGLEMAENLYDRGIEVTLVEMANQVMPPVDEDMAKIVENHMVSKGVHLLLNEGFDGVINNGKTVVLKSNKSIDTDMVLLSIGVRPNSELAESCGLELNSRKGIKVDKYQKTSDDDIYAVGDVAGVVDYVMGNETMIPLAGPANKQGRSVASNLLGLNKEKYVGSMGTSVAKVFDLTVAAVGVNEKTLNRMGKEYKKDYFVAMVHPMSHAGYYPNAKPLTIKLIFGSDRKILGAQIVGYDGVDKRIDTIATSIHFNGTVDDLIELELAYAPPYSSAKDPVNFAGYVATNILNGLTTPYLYREVKDRKDIVFVDVREEAEVSLGKLDGAINVPLSRLRDNLDVFKKDIKYVVYCAVGIRGYVAERILKQNGIDASNLSGGYRSIKDYESDISYDPSHSTEQDKFHNEKTLNAMKESKFIKYVSENSVDSRVELLNVCGLSCPGPIVKVASAMKNLNDNEVLEVKASDPGFSRDIDSWCTNTGNTLLEKWEDNGTYFARIRKGTNNIVSEKIVSNQKEKTMIIFDGDLDKAIASFIIANGAAAMGNKVHMFFTFWGLSLLRKQDPVKVEKDFMSKMFSLMLPKGSTKLKLSKMNFCGIGPKMIRSIMKKKGVDSLEDLIKQAMENGVEITACQMSMDIMGISKEELIEGVSIGGVASMLNDSDNSNMNLFI